MTEVAEDTGAFKVEVGMIVESGVPGGVGEEKEEAEGGMNDASGSGVGVVGGEGVVAAAAGATVLRETWIRRGSEACVPPSSLDRHHLMDQTRTKTATAATATATAEIGGKEHRFRPAGGECPHLTSLPRRRPKPPQPALHPPARPRLAALVLVHSKALEHRQPPPLR